MGILTKYASAYTKAFINQECWKPIYIDAFSGKGEFSSCSNSVKIPGSPLAALNIRPKFDEFHFIEMDTKKYKHLKSLVRTGNDVFLYHADCNNILLEMVFPGLTWNDGKKALCFIDPDGIHVNWKVIEKAGRLGTVEILLNFAVSDLRRNIFRHKKSKVHSNEIARMNNFWGDDSWKNIESEIQADFFLKKILILQILKFLRPI